MAGQSTKAEHATAVLIEVDYLGAIAEHFTIDGTLLEAWAGQKSFKRKDQPSDPPDDPGNPTVNFHGERRSNQTHASKTDPEAQMARKGEGKESKLSYSGNLLVENRNGLIVNAEVFLANGTAERDAALVMLEQIPGGKLVTVGGDKGFDTRDFVAECRHLGVTPHVAQNDTRRGGSALDQRTTRHAGWFDSSASRRCASWTAMLPAPTAEATRLTDPWQTSPAANTPGRLVSSSIGWRSRGQGWTFWSATSSPVRT